MILYQLAIRLYAFLIRIAALFNPKAKLWVQGRRGWEKKLEGMDHSKKTVWFHAASLGEYEQAKPVIASLRDRAEVQILVSFFSPSGYEIRKNDPLADRVTYLPLDTKGNARKFLNLVQPDLAVFVRYEFWPNILDELHKRSIPSCVISAHFRNNQFLFRPMGKLLLNRLKKMNSILIQYPSSADLLEGAGINLKTVHVCGDSRIDRVLHIADKAKEDHIVPVFKGEKPLLILGSSYTDEESFIFPLLEKEMPLKVLIAPHYIDEPNLRRIEGSLPIPSVRYSQWDAKGKDQDVMVLDTMGMLASLYRYGDFALIGGGFIGGIHSILEPAAYGLPLFFGPDHESFPEAKKLIDLGAGHQVKNQKEFLDAFYPILENPEKRKDLALSIRLFMQSHAGASEKIVDRLLPWI